MRRKFVFLGLAALGTAGCARAQEPAVNQAQANAAQAPASPTERAQRLVVQRLGNEGDVGFGEAQVFSSNGATVVCGRYQQPGRPAQRYMVIGEEDVFVEGEFEGDMNEAVAEACRNT